MPQHPLDPPSTPPQPPIVAGAGRSFWSEAIRAVASFIAAQSLIAVGLPADDWARSLLVAVGGETTSGQGWWIAASALSLGLYLLSRRLWRPGANAKAAT